MDPSPTDAPASGSSRSRGNGTIQGLLHDLVGRGQRPALLWLDGHATASLSCSDLAFQAEGLASGLLARGFVPGTFAAIIAPNGQDWIVARFAIGAAGGIAVAVDDLSSEAEIASVFSDTEIAWAFVSPNHAAAVRRIGGERLKVVLLGYPGEIGTDGPHWRAIMADEPGCLPAIDETAPAMLVYTSGTTGNPKAFLLRYDHLWSNVGALAREGMVGSNDRVAVPLPFHHVYPFVVGILAVLQSGAAVVIADPAKRADLLEALHVLQVTAIAGVPRLYAAMVMGLQERISAAGVAASALRRLMDWSSALRGRYGINIGRFLFRRVRGRIGGNLRLLVSGGARLEPEALRPLVGLGFDVRSGYGLAETASIFTGNLPGRERIGSEGRPFQGGELRIADAQPDGVGEIQLRGPNVFDGYRGNPAANAGAFTADGWFRSGDLGRVDVDGYLYVVGRSKEMLVLGGGKKVNPEELEKVYGASACIREIAVFESAGSLVALVIPDLDAIRAGGYRVEDAVRIALAETSQTLPTYQRLSGYVLVREPLPRTRLGKFRRFLLPAIYERAKSGRTPPSEPRTEDRALLDKPSVRPIWTLFRERYPDAALTLDANLQLDLGIDSLDWIGLLLAIEQRSGIRLDERDIAQVDTVRDLLEIAARAPSRAPASSAGELRWIEPTGPVLRAAGTILHGLNRVLMRLLFHVTARGLENLPERGPVLIVANHVSDLDPLVIAAVLPLARMRRTYWGGAANRLFTRSWIAPLWRALHVMPVDERAPLSSLALPSAVLARGESLIWFPEAWRSPDGTLQQFLPGVGKLIADSGVTAVPAFIAGSYDALPRGRRVPRLHRIEIRFGRAVTPAELDGIDEPAIRPVRIATALRDRVHALSQSEAM